jgi:hypothetical protein
MQVSWYTGRPFHELWLNILVCLKTRRYCNAGGVAGPGAGGCMGRERCDEADIAAMEHLQVSGHDRMASYHAISRRIPHHAISRLSEY